MAGAVFSFPSSNSSHPSHSSSETFITTGTIKQVELSWVESTPTHFIFRLQLHRLLSFFPSNFCANLMRTLLFSSLLFWVQSSLGSLPIPLPVFPPLSQLKLSSGRENVFILFYAFRPVFVLLFIFLLCISPFLFIVVGEVGSGNGMKMWNGENT